MIGKILGQIHCPNRNSPQLEWIPTGKFAWKWF